MVRIETIDLSTRHVEFPDDRVGMVIAQPYLSLSGVEPFQCVPDSRGAQLAAITQTLEISKRADHRAEKTHFTIFPEYSICGVEGINIIQNTISAGNWPNETVVIGGTDALTKAEFVALCQAENTNIGTIGHDFAQIRDYEWVNCKITWVKGRNGTVERWLQPKIAPAWPEMDIAYQQMFQGNTVYTFKGLLKNQVPFRFCSLICFDWIAEVQAKKIWEWVLDDLNREALQAGGLLPLSWFFIIQRNASPSHNTFLSEVSRFFDPRLLPRIIRSQTCLVFSNGAGNSNFGKANTYGQTGLVFLRQNVFQETEGGLTFCKGGPKFRNNSTLLQGYTDVLFREKGPCIHSFAQINPASRAQGPTGRTFAIQNAAVFPFTATTDKRAPSAPVSAVTKWWNDELDTARKLSETYPDLPISGELETNHYRNVTGLRGIDNHAAWKAIKLAAQQSNAENADQFVETEVRALENLINALNILSLGGTAPSINNDNVHATVTLQNQQVDLIAILGHSHEDCWRHCQKSGITAKPRRDLLIVSKDTDNTGLTKRSGSILNPNTRGLGEQRKITEPSAGILHIGYSNLLATIRGGNNLAAVQGAINGQLAA